MVSFFELHRGFEPLSYRFAGGRHTGVFLLRSVCRRPTPCAQARASRTSQSLQVIGVSRVLGNRSHNPACSRASAPVPLLRLRSKSAVRCAHKVGVHPRVSRHRGKSASVLISRLTLPSSGPAYGGPLKSYVRRLWSRCPNSSVKVRAASLSLRRHLAHRSLSASVSWPPE